MAAALAMVACSVPEDAPEATDEPLVVEVFTNYRGAEAEAFRAVLEDFTARTGVATRFIGTAGFAARLPDRVREGNPPDVALIPQPALLAELARDERLVPLDLPQLGDTMLEGAASVGLVDGARYGVWFRASVKSLVWYPPAVFEEAGYPIPTTWEELLALTRRIERDGGTPWCLGIESFDSTGWVGTDWIEDLVLRLYGPEVYDPWAAGRLPFTDERIEAAFEEFGRIALVEGRVVGGPRGMLASPALRAIDPMLEDPPGCLLSRQGSFQAAELPDAVTVGPDGDLDVFVFPGLDEDRPAPLVAAGEIAAAFTDRPGVAALLEYLADPAAGEVWAARGGFLSPHASFERAAYADPFDRQVADLLTDAEVVRFDGSDRMPTQVGTGAFWTGIIDLITGAPLDRVLADIEAERPSPAPS